MKYLKNVVAFSMAILLLVSNASAIDQQKPAPCGLDEETLEQLSQAEMNDFIDYISLFFENPHEYHAIDFSGNDISEDFYDMYYPLYQTKDYQNLKDIVRSEIAWLEQVTEEDATWENTFDNSISPFATTKNLQTSTHLSYISNLLLDFEFAISLTGNYTYDTSRQRITKTEDPYVSLYYYQFPLDATLTITNIVKSSQILNNGQRAKFSVTFSVYRTTNGADWEPLYCGKFNGYIIGDTNGGLPVEFSPEDYGYPISK